MSNFAELDHDFSYWQKQTQPLFADLIWNLPEQKTGTVTIIWEDVHLREAAGANELQRGGELLLRLTGETGNEVRGDGGTVDRKSVV